MARGLFFALGYRPGLSLVFRDFTAFYGQVRGE